MSRLCESNGRSCSALCNGCLEENFESFPLWKRRCSTLLQRPWPTQGGVCRLPLAESKKLSATQERSPRKSSTLKLVLGRGTATSMCMYYICVSVCLSICHITHMEVSSAGNLKQLVLSFYHVGLDWQAWWVATLHPRKWRVY